MRPLTIQSLIEGRSRLARQMYSRNIKTSQKKAIANKDMLKNKARAERKAADKAAADKAASEKAASEKAAADKQKQQNDKPAPEPKAGSRTKQLVKSGLKKGLKAVGRGAVKQMEKEFTGRAILGIGRGIRGVYRAGRKLGGAITKDVSDAYHKKNIQPHLPPDEGDDSMAARAFAKREKETAKKAEIKKRVEKLRGELPMSLESSEGIRPLTLNRLDEAFPLIPLAYAAGGAALRALAGRAVAAGASRLVGAGAARLASTSLGRTAANLGAKAPRVVKLGKNLFKTGVSRTVKDALKPKGYGLSDLAGDVARGAKKVVGGVKQGAENVTQTGADNYESPKPPQYKQ